MCLPTNKQSVVYGEIRLATDSVLPVRVMGTIGDAFGTAILLNVFIQLTPGSEFLVSPGAEGVVRLILMLTIEYWLHQLWKAGYKSRHLVLRGESDSIVWK